jgi:O-antigen/teichoic acid export membrane protein
MKNSGDKRALIRAAGIGAVFNIFGGVWQTFVRLGASVFLARLLSPADFGIYGIAMLTKTFIENMGNVGMGAGLIAKKEIDEKDLNTCFWSIALVRVCLLALALLGAPLAGIFFNEPKMVMPLRVVSLTFVLTVLGVVSSKILDRKLKFGYLVTIQNVAILVESVVAVLLAAFTDLSYWALVFGMLAATVVNEIGVVVYAGWLPKLQFDKERFRYLFYFGRNQMGTHINMFLQKNVDYLLVGKMFGARVLGLYEFAYRIPHMLEQKFIRKIKNVIFPSFSRLQDSDEDLINGYINVVRLIAMAVFPALIGLFVLAFPTVDILWGEKWHPIIMPLRVLCLPAMISCLVIPVQAVFLCKQRPDLPFKLSLFRVAATFLSVLVLGTYFGLIGVAFGMMISSLAGFLNIYLAFKLTKKRLVRLYWALFPTLLGSSCMGVMVYLFYSTLITYTPMYASYLFSILLGVAVYIIIYLIFFTKEIQRIKTLMQYMMRAKA